LIIIKVSGVHEFVDSRKMYALFVGFLCLFLSIYTGAEYWTVVSLQL